MNGGYLQALLFMLNRPEPIRQASLLMVLATGVGTGAALLNGLKFLAEESASPWSDQIRQLRIMLEHGATLSDALTSQPGMLPEQTLVAIRVAEKTGTLRQVLTDEAHRLMNRSQNSSPVVGSLPVSVLWLGCVWVLTMTVLAFLCVFIVPKLKFIFDDFALDLPDNTRMLIEFSDWATAYWFIVLFPAASVVMIAIGAAVWGHYQQVSRGRILYSEHLPRYWTPLLLRMFSLTVAAQDSLRETLHNIVCELRPGLAANRISALRQAVESGSNCFAAMRQLRLLNSREVAFLHAAEKSRHLDWGLLHLAASVERRRMRWSQRLLNAVFPAVILLTGLLVGFICVALFQPMIQLIDDLA